MSSFAGNAVLRRTTTTTDRHGATGCTATMRMCMRTHAYDAQPTMRMRMRTHALDAQPTMRMRMCMRNIHACKFGMACMADGSTYRPTMCVYAPMHMRTCIYTYACAHICIHARVRAHARMHARIHLMHAYVCTCMHARTHRHAPRPVRRRGAYNAARV